MEKEITEVLEEVKRICYQSIRTVERLMLYTSLAHNATQKIFGKRRKQEGYWLSLEELSALRDFQLIRNSLIQLSRSKEEGRKKEFYLLRRHLIETIESLPKRASVPPAPQEDGLSSTLATVKTVR